MSDVTFTEIQAKVFEFIRDSFLYEIGADGLTPDTNLFEAGVMDSYSLVELACFIEAEFKVKLQDAEMVSPRLATYNGIVLFIHERITQ